MTTVDSLLDAVKARHGITSDYKLAQFLKMTQNSISNYRHGRSRPDDKTLTRLAELGNIDPSAIDVLAAQLQAERATNGDAKLLWQRIAHRLEAGAVSAVMMFVLAIVSLAGFSPNAEATALSFSKSATQSVYYVKSLLKVIAQWCRKVRRLSPMHCAAHTGCTA